MSYTTTLEYNQNQTYLSGLRLRVCEQTVCALIYTEVSTLLIIMWSSSIGRSSSVVITINNRKHLVISCSNGMVISGWLGSMIVKEISVSVQNSLTGL